MCVCGLADVLPVCVRWGSGLRAARIQVWVLCVFGLASNPELWDNS